MPKDDILELINDNILKPIDSTYQGVAEGRNVILIQVEALQDFVLNLTYNDQILTPNLNKLMVDSSIYFSNYYSTIGKGNTADAEFTTFNSIYPVIQREIYTLYETNTFQGLPWLLKEKGYSTFAVHGYEEQFWNRKNAYPYQGIDTFYALEQLDDSEKIGLGISDQSMFEQTIDLIKEQDGNYFAFINTLTNHHPYVLDDNLCEIELLEEHQDTKFGSYLQTVHYTDRVIGEFIQDLKDEGLYDNTIIALYGDHHGLNYEMDDNAEIMETIIDRQYDYDEMLHIPLIIHIPNSNYKETIKTVGGQIDFLPTFANIMGLEIEHPYIMGQDLINAKTGFVAFTAYLLEGSFATDDIMYEVSRHGT